MFDTKTTGDKEGVSPVIGVILMVAITVILAAVIGTFVLDLAGNLQQNAQMSVTFDEDTTAQTVDAQINSVQSGENVELRASGNTASTAWTNHPATVGTEATNISGTTYSGGNTIAFAATAGSSATLNYTGSGTITVVGFLDGQGSVIQTYDYGA